MKKLKKLRKLLPVTFVLALAVLLLPCRAKAATTVASGNCGPAGNDDAVTWTLDTDGVLTISGSGPMRDAKFSGSNKYSPGYLDYDTEISAIVIESGITAIGNNVFSNCSALSVQIPGTVTSIGSKAFNCCEGLVEVTIPDSMQTLGNSAFYGCTSLKQAFIGGGVTAIGANAFEYCTALESVFIGEGVQTIGSEAFLDCSSLKRANIPASMTDISDAFATNCGISKSNVGYVYYAGSEADWASVAGTKTNFNTVKYNYVPLESIALQMNGTVLSEGQEITINKGSSITLNTIATPSNATNKAGNWSFSRGIVSFVGSTDTLKANTVGTTYATFTTLEGNKTATCRIKVVDPSSTPISVTGLTLDKSTLALDQPSEEDIARGAGGNAASRHRSSGERHLQRSDVDLQ